MPLPQPEVLDFSGAIAAIQVRIDLLVWMEDATWCELPTMQCWLDAQCRYSLSYEDYCNLAESLKQQCKQVFRNRHHGKE